MIIHRHVVAFIISIFSIHACPFPVQGNFTVTVVRDSKSFSFPIFRSNDKQEAVTRINRFLQLAELQSLAKGRTRRIFDQVKINDGSIYGGKVWMHATIYSNRRSLLSIGFAESSCGMTCAYWNRYHTFNPGNGDRILLGDFFTPAGFEKFTQLILQRRRAKYRREVAIKIPKTDWGDSQGPLACFENDDLRDYYIKGRSIVIDGENCLIKAEKFSGLDMEVTFRFRDFRKYLNDYGEAAFGVRDAPIDNFRSFELPQLFEGRVGHSIPVAMVLEPDGENGYRGVYAYLKYGEGIGLEGTAVDAGVSLKEFVLSATTEPLPYGDVRKYLENGSITGRLVGTSLEGTWSSLDGTRVVPLAVGIR